MNKLVKYIMESRFNFNIDQLDLEDNEGEFSLSKQQYKSKSMKQEYIENNLFVDLGLPSGTLWAKYNLGVNPTKLNSPKDWYGNYYAWGEIEENKFNYNWTSYKFSNGYGRAHISKYFSNKEGSCSKLLPEDDVAYKLNPIQRIPSKNQFEELLKYTDNEWIDSQLSEQYNANGRLFTSKINGNQLFIPASGYISSNLFYGIDNSCFLYSSDIDDVDPAEAWALGFTSRSCVMRRIARYNGLCIRPIAII